MLDKKIVITGGGSGGHISAATAVIEGLKEKYPNTLDQILYIGGNLAMEGDSESTSLEDRLIGESEIPYVSIRAGKLQRYFSFKSIKLLKGVIGGYIDARRELKKFKPDFVFSFGGYVTVPVCLAAWRMGIPVYIHEQTAGVGLTNKITGKVAKRVYISFESSRDSFNPDKTIHVGNAVRPQIFKTDGKGDVVDAVGKMAVSKEKYPIVLIAGGGQGSHILNLTVRQMIRYGVEQFQIILQTGDNKVHRDFELIEKEWGKLMGGCKDRFFPVKFIDQEEIGYVFDKIDIFVGRSGANFVYEMGVLEIPSIFVPIPWVTNNEQYKNAMTLVDTGLARVLPEGELSAERLFKELNDLKDAIDSNKLEIDQQKLRKAFPTDAVSKILNDLPL